MVTVKKMNIFILLGLALIVFSSSTIAGNDPIFLLNKSKDNVPPSTMSSKKIVEGGFYVHFGMFLPTKNYYCPKGFENKTSNKFGLGYGVELGELFQLVESRSAASFGLRFTFLNAVYTTYTSNNKTTEQVIQGSAFDFGPCLSLGLDNKNAIDLFYQFCPTYMYNFKDTANYTNSGSFGLNHVFGIGYRYSILSIGAVYNMGNVKYIDATNNTDLMKHRMDHFRFYVGLMF
jgi:hypothetical protein